MAQQHDAKIPALEYKKKKKHGKKKREGRDNGGDVTVCFGYGTTNKAQTTQISRSTKKEMNKTRSKLGIGLKINQAWNVRKNEQRYDQWSASTPQKRSTVRHTFKHFQFKKFRELQVK